MSGKAALVIGTAVILVFGAAVAFGLNATHGMPFADRKTVKAAFDEVGGLIEGDDVRIASSRVGYVDDIRIEHGRAVAVLKIDDETTKIYRDATATTASVGARSALGQKFVDLDPGSPAAGELPPGKVIPKHKTLGAHEITELFNVFDRRTREAAGSTLRQFGGGLAGHQRDLHDLLATAPSMLPALGTVSDSLAARDGADLTAMLASADRLASRFTGREREIANLTRQLGSTMDAVAADGGSRVAEILYRSPRALDEATTALNALSGPLADTESAMRTLRPGARALGAATDDLRGVFREGVEPLRKVPAVAAEATPAVADLTGVMTDARPLASQLVDTGSDAAVPLSVLTPYRGEISTFFTRAASALSQGDAAGNWLRIYLVPRSESVSGTAPVKDPTVSGNPYPGPGEAGDDSASMPGEGGGR
ncbi:MAG: MCE family protein [Actinophytocola sp.]|nr:MCE family protein [Actinophytocola sp.]